MPRPVPKIIASSHLRVFQFTLSLSWACLPLGVTCMNFSSGSPKGLIKVVRMVGSTSIEIRRCDAGETIGYHKPCESHRMDMLIQTKTEKGIQKTSSDGMWGNSRMWNNQRKGGMVA